MKGNYKHGMCGTRIYNIWASMIGRCRWKSHTSWKWYGGRGIKVCRRWLKFENFLSDMGHPPFDGATIDRVDVHGNYDPDNCRWATITKQARNRNGNLLLTYGNTTQCASDWAEQLGIPTHRIHDRKRRGWSDVRALTSPRFDSRMVIQFKGRVHNLRDWAVLLGIKPGTLWYRINRGWTVEQAFTTKTMTPSECAKFKQPD